MDFSVEPVVDEAAVWAEVEVAVDGPGSELRPVPWKITGLGQAGWAMKKLAELRAVQAQYDDEIERWRRAQVRVRSAAGWFEDRLKEWAITERTTTIKSFTLPAGTVSTRQAAQPRIIVTNDEAAVAWAEVKCPEAVKVEKSLLVSKLSGVMCAVNADGLGVVIDSDGVQVPGLGTEQPQVTASVKVERPEVTVMNARIFTPAELGTA